MLESLAPHTRDGRRADGAGLGSTRIAALLLGARLEPGDAGGGPICGASTDGAERVDGARCAELERGRRSRRATRPAGHRGDRRRGPAAARCSARRSRSEQAGAGRRLDDAGLASSERGRMRRRNGCNRRSRHARTRAAVVRQTRRTSTSSSTLLGRFESGEIGPDEWRAFRLLRGTYGQRQTGDAQMLRVKIPQGILDVAAARRAWPTSPSATRAASATSPPGRTSSCTS